MARVANNHHHGNTSLPTTSPFMDRLSHAVIKETSKNLRHYLDVKRRENGFVLNPNSSALESSPTRARYIYGTAKAYPPHYGSSYSDNDIKIYTRNFQQQQRQAESRMNSQEKQMCREELNYHMHTNKSASKETQKFAELRLRPQMRSTSASSVTSGRDFRRETPRSAFKLPRHEQNQLVDNTATILASMIKTRRSIYETNLQLQQSPHTYVSQHTNPSPRPADEQSNVRPAPLSIARSSIDSGHSTNNPQMEQKKRTTKNTVEESLSIMRKAQPMTKGLLCDYKVSVTTGNCNGASSDAPIRMKFYGTNGYTAFVDLTHSETHRVPFTKDQTDIFTVETDHVGQLAGITIGHDRKDIRSGWFLNKVSINDPIRETTSDIPCNAWLSSKSNDQKTMRDFPVTAMVSHKKPIDLNEHRRHTGNESDDSITTREGTTVPNSPNSHHTDQVKDHERIRKHRKQRHVSMAPTTVTTKRTSLTAITNELSQPPPATTIESHFDHMYFCPLPPSPPVAARRARSPIIPSSSSSDAEIEDHVVNHHHHQTSSTPSSTFDKPHRKSTKNRKTPPKKQNRVEDHSPDHNHPSVGLEKHHSPISTSPTRPIKSKEDTNSVDSFYLD